MNKKVLIERIQEDNDLHLGLLSEEIDTLREVVAMSSRRDVEEGGDE